MLQAMAKPRCGVHSLARMQPEAPLIMQVYRYHPALNAFAKSYESQAGSHPDVKKSQEYLRGTNTTQTDLLERCTKGPRESRANGTLLRHPL